MQDKVSYCLENVLSKVIDFKLHYLIMTLTVSLSQISLESLLLVFHLVQKVSQ